VIELLSQSDLHSRYFQSVAQGLTVCAGRLTRPAETNSHLVITKGPQHTLAHLERSGVLDFDPVVAESLENATVKMPERTLRYRFLSSVGFSKASIFQIQRIKQAALLVSQGLELTEIALSLGFYDQSHLTRNFNKYLCVTPGKSRYAQKELR
jgi:AraC-like DNA-binding protein